MSNPTISRLLVTGGAGFIGSAFIRYLLEKVPHIEKVVNLDLLTYAGNLDNLSSVSSDPRYAFVHGDILNSPLAEQQIRTHEIEAIVHFAAESHVDRSIENPRAFYRTNVEGTLSLLEVLRRFPDLHFHHVSTDEVYGSVEEGTFTEESLYQPNSPYAASKAASDHFVRAYANTYGLSVTLSHSSNNYGPCQFAEKFIPRMITGCLKEEPLPVYGKGINVRDWIYVEDHVEAIWLIVENGQRGQTYNIGGKKELRNIDLLKMLIKRVAHAKGHQPEKYHSLITFVEDRPGHDLRYSLQCEKIEKELGWEASHPFELGLEKTIAWYLEHSHVEV
ncbi:MAG: dTDP-glucose 4,6-dehydratase 2 [Chlamydiae bacterium]|nr:dTDP-glucose 4,6-dehydratase 2 [Chlamydiota bacterium]